MREQGEPAHFLEDGRFVFAGHDHFIFETVSLLNPRVPRVEIEPKASPPQR